jgi:hypothetical protein
MIAMRCGTADGAKRWLWLRQDGKKNKTP